MEDEIPAIVIDNGSGYIRSGFAGEDAPRSVMPNLVGFPRQQAAFLGLNYKSSYVGDAAQAYRGILALRYPVENGYIKHWDAMEEILEFIYKDELRVDPKTQALLMTAPVLNPVKDRDKMYEIVFDKLEVAAAKIEPQPLLSMYGSGRNTGMVLEIGDGVIQTYPVTNGYTINNAITRTNFGGRDLTKHLADLLRENGHSFESSSELDVVRQIKEEICYTALDFKRDLLETFHSTSLMKSYPLPDGYEIMLDVFWLTDSLRNIVQPYCLTKRGTIFQLLTLANPDSPRFRVPEALFQPHLVGLEQPGIHEILFNAINKCPQDTRINFYGNIVLSGGTTMLPGFADRLTQEIAALAPPTAKVNVVAPPERKYSSWIGGSILASLSTYQQHWLGLQDYRECGVVGRRSAF